MPFTVNEEQQGCTDDINFRFTGFTLSGKVLASSAPTCSSGTGGGPAGVSLTLVAADGRISHTTSVAGGSYVFTNVFPGTYSVSATHPVWTLTPATHEVTMAWGNAEVKEPFQLNGYDVQGKVTTSGEAATGVDVFLYSTTNVDIECPQPAANTARPGTSTLSHGGREGKGREGHTIESVLIAV